MPRSRGLALGALLAAHCASPHGALSSPTKVSRPVDASGAAPIRSCAALFPAGRPTSPWAHADASGKLESITLSCDGTTATHRTAGAFIFIGLDPNTSFLDDALDVDGRGFILTDTNFRTSVDGIFAAGDVRSGSTKQIASAVGEGAAVAIQIRYYLDSLDRVTVNS